MTRRAVLGADARIRSRSCCRIVDRLAALLRMLVLVAMGAASAMAQELGPFAERVRQFCREVMREQPPSPRVAEIEALAAEFTRLAPSLSRTDVASATVDLVYLAPFLGRGADWVEPLLAQAEQVFATDPEAVDGLAPVLARRAHHALESGLPFPEADWCALWRRAPGPKRFWLAAECARSLVNHGRRPALAERELSAAIAELLATPAWSERVRARVAADPDLYLTMRERPAAGNHADVLGQLLLLRAFAREQLGSLLGARDDLLEAAELLERTGNRHRRVNCDHNLVAIQLQLGRFDDALRLAEATYAAYRDESHVWASDDPGRADRNGMMTMQKLAAQARVARGLPGDQDAALADFEALAAMSLTETNLDVFSSIAELRLQRLPVGGEDPAIVQALDTLRRRLGSTREQALVVRAELLHADYERRLGRLEAARDRLAKVATVLAAIHHPLLDVEHAIAQGCVELDSGAWDAGLAEFERAGALLRTVVLEQQMWRRAGAASVFVARFQQLLDGAYRAFGMATARGAGDPESRFPTLVRLYSVMQAFHGFESACAGDATGWIGNDDAKARALLGELQAAQLQHAELLVRPAGNPIAERRRTEQLAKAGRRIDDADAALQGLARAQSPVSERRGTEDLVIVQQALRPGELLVECCDAGGRAFAFLIRPDEVQVVPLPCGPDFEEQLRSTLAAVERGADDTAAAGLQWLAEALWPEPGGFAEAFGAPGTLRLLWSPEGVFAALPLAAMPFRGAPAVQHRPIVHCVSGDHLARERRATDPRPPRSSLRLLAIGRPETTEPALLRLGRLRMGDGDGFPPLPESAGEVRDIAAVYATNSEREGLDRLSVDALRSQRELQGERFRVLLGEAASEANVLAAAGDRDVLHFACHAAAEPGAPWLSFLVLALGPLRAGGTDGDDGLLRLSEWWRLRRPRELVVLSACRTSVATLGDHDVAGGLAWAAQMAGARRVIASLWKVEDGAARAFSAAFHREFVARGAAAADALASTQRAAIRAGRPWREWAGFVLWGDPE